MTFSLRKLFAATAVAALFFAALSMVRESIIGRTRVSRRIEACLESMSAITPNGLTPQQWQVMVDWTRNLHANSLLAFQTSCAEILSFESRLNARLDRGCGADSIEWIWYEYAAVCEGGRRYQRFRLPWSIAWLRHNAYTAHVAERHGAALKLYTRFLERDPQDTWAYLNRSLIYKSLGFDDKAMIDLQKARELGPTIEGP